MPVSPIVGQSFETQNGLKADVQYKFAKPDINGILFTGIVKLNGDDQAAQWKADGTSPIADYTLDSLWPADDARQYQPIQITTDGVFRALAVYYAELGSLKHDWYPRGIRFALKLDRDPNDPSDPIASIENFENEP